MSVKMLILEGSDDSVYNHWAFGLHVLTMDKVQKASVSEQ
jgi:hypothetical protein